MSMNTTRRIQGQIQPWWRPVLGFLFFSCSKQSIPHFICMWSYSLRSGWSFNINWDIAFCLVPQWRDSRNHSLMQKIYVS